MLIPAEYNAFLICRNPLKQAIQSNKSPHVGNELTVLPCNLPDQRTVISYKFGQPRARMSSEIRLIEKCKYDKLKITKTTN